jgi:hypothetical protein
MPPSTEIHDYFEQFATTRWDIASQDVRDFEHALEDARDESSIQAYLQDHPQLLCAYMRSGHGEWVIPQKRLGAEYVPDFVIGHGGSGGFLWDFIELESPLASFTIQNGQPAKELRTAPSSR